MSRYEKEPLILVDGRYSSQQMISRSLVFELQLFDPNQSSCHRNGDSKIVPKRLNDLPESIISGNDLIKICYVDVAEVERLQAKF